MRVPYSKGHFSNRVTRWWILCLSSGAALIYHDSSKADIQILFEWHLNAKTYTHSCTHLNSTHHTHKHSVFIQGWVFLCARTYMICDDDDDVSIVTSYSMVVASHKRLFYKMFNDVRKSSGLRSLHFAFFSDFLQH